MVPLDSVMTLRNDSGPYRVVRYNLYPSAELQGDTARGYSSGQSLKTMERLAGEMLPQGFAFDWTELAFEQQQAGNTGAIAFALAVVFVFLLLAAQYESLVLPLAVILIVPMCLLAAILGVNLMGLDNNILTQIGLVVLIGLAAKNAILIVEFAKQNEEQGHGAARGRPRTRPRQRLRPILMTSIAFILGTLPLVIGSGPGSEMRQALGVAVFFGMIGVTVFGLLFTPAFYVISRNFGDWATSKLRRGPRAEPAEAADMKRLGILLAALLAGCAVGPDYRPPAPLPEAALKLSEAGLAQVTPTPLPPKWWRLFDDPALDRLVETALQHNTDLRQAAANLQRARAVMSEARAGRLPVTDLSARYTRQRFGGQSFGNVPGEGSEPITTDFFTLGADAAYEVDLFGGVTRSIEAARADYQAAQAQVDASRVSVAAETARAYVLACAFAAQAAVARETADLQASTLDLTQRLYSGGRGTERDVDQAQALAEQARAQTPTLEAERRAALAALSVLTGQAPARIDDEAERCLSPPTPTQPIPIGDGQALLARRPDVRQAERTLAADTARIGVATAALYPSITLLGAINLGAPRIRRSGRQRIVRLFVRAADQLELPLQQRRPGPRPPGGGDRARARSRHSTGRCCARCRRPNRRWRG